MVQSACAQPLVGGGGGGGEGGGGDGGGGGLPPPPPPPVLPNAATFGVPQPVGPSHPAPALQRTDGEQLPFEPLVTS